MSNHESLTCPAPQLITSRLPSAKPFVSVIVPVYNDATSLERLFLALEQQDYGGENFECVVIDNASAESLSGFNNRVFEVRLLHEPQAGSYAARNCGLRAASGTVLAFTDADCVPDKTWLSSAVRLLSGANGPLIVGGRLEVLHADNSNNSALAWHSVVNDLDQRRFVTHYHFAATANMVTTADVFQRVGAFDPAFLSGGDLEWGRRAWSMGIGRIFAEEAVVRHPARACFRSLVAKTRRIAGGHYQYHNGKGEHFLATVVTTLRIACASASRSWRDPRLPTLNCRLRVVAIDLALRLIQMAEIIRLRLGGQPTRH